MDPAALLAPHDVVLPMPIAGDRVAPDPVQSCSGSKHWQCARSTKPVIWLTLPGMHPAVVWSGSGPFRAGSPRQRAAACPRIAGARCPAWPRPKGNGPC